MFARQGIRAARVGVKPVCSVRYASSVGQKVSGFVDCASYWTKVVGEVSKQVYNKEGLSPPSGAEFSKLWTETKASALSFVKNPQVVGLQLTNGFQAASAGDFVKWACYLIQIIGFFSLGEMIGRRQIVGYPSFGPKAELKKIAAEQQAAEEKAAAEKKAAEKKAEKADKK